MNQKWVCKLDSSTTCLEFSWIHSLELVELRVSNKSNKHDNNRLDCVVIRACMASHSMSSTNSHRRNEYTHAHTHSPELSTGQTHQRYLDIDIFPPCLLYTFSSAHPFVFIPCKRVNIIRIPANKPIKPSTLPSPTHQEGHNTNTLTHTPHHTVDQPKRREAEKKRKKKKKRWRRRSKERRSQEESIDSIGFFQVSVSLCPSIRIDYITRTGCVFVYIFFIKSSFHVLSVHGN